MVLLSSAIVTGDERAEFTPEQIDFFEARVRPLLSEHCFECHSSKSEKLKGGLKLDSREAALTGGDSGPALVAGKPDESLLVDAVRWKSFEMPPKAKLPAEQIDVLARWVELGAPWPAEDGVPASLPPVSYDWDQLRGDHWAWQAVAQPPLPAVKQQGWVSNPIDVFVLAGLEASGLAPSPPADPRTLIRRLYFDLIGLPPEPEKIDAFILSANRDQKVAVAELIDELLESPHYGERWGRHWLDVARYSDGFGGFLDGAAMPNAWRYRDWVVESLNQDRPMDEFIRLQVAGDLVEPPQAVATGFFALGPTYISDGGDPDATAQAKSETLDDRVDTLTRGLLGVTVSCARCHDHKFDPIPQLDYYSLAGIFNNTKLTDFPLAPAESVRRYDDHQSAIREFEQKIAKRDQESRKEGRALTVEETQQQKADNEALEQLRKSSPAAYPTAHAIVESGSGDMNLAIRGNLRKPGPIAPRRFLRITAGENGPLFTKGSGRLELADQLVSRSNPLTARVLVNRVWLQHFGQGLVRTPSNFGTLGERPTHPGLLNWLAAEFMDGPSSDASGSTQTRWSLKRLHRLILLSSTWQMSSGMNDAAFAVDADNRTLWRMNPRRLDVEAWRDSFLAVTGDLDRTLGGSPVDQLLESSRRTLYAPVSRNGDRYASDAFLRLFDFPLPRATSEGRKSSVVPQQSLFLMNSPFMAARSKALTIRLQREGQDDSARISRAYQLLYGREPADDERQLGLEFLQTQETSTDATLSLWEQYAQVLLSANEFMHLK